MELSILASMLISAPHSNQFIARSVLLIQRPYSIDSLIGSVQMRTMTVSRHVVEFRDYVESDLVTAIKHKLYKRDAVSKRFGNFWYIK